MLQVRGMMEGMPLERLIVGLLEELAKLQLIGLRAKLTKE